MGIVLIAAAVFVWFGVAQLTKSWAVQLSVAAIVGALWGVVRFSGMQDMAARLGIPSRSLLEVAFSGAVGMVIYAAIGMAIYRFRRSRSQA